MHFDESDSDLLKKWIIKKLEDISDADSDVLADYVLALIKTDEPEAVARSNCVENLSDFLLDNTQAFVNDVFTAVATKAYDPSRGPSKIAPSTAHAPNTTPLDTARQSRGARKRTYNDREHDDSNHNQISTFAGGERPVKQARRGGRGGSEQRGGRFAHSGSQRNGTPNFVQPGSMPIIQMPVQSTGMDPDNPFTAFLAMQQAMGLLPTFSDANVRQNQGGSKTGQRCKDYDTMGFCARGASCPYDHGNDPFVVPLNSEYNPNQASLLDVQPSRTGYLKASPNERGRSGYRNRGRGGPNSRGGRRSDFSQHGPNQDRSIRQIVVEQIPDDHLNETSVRDFFNEFGAIEDISMQPERRLAVLKFDTHEAARAAYESPKVIFDNRFVKVYWYKGEGAQKHVGSHGSSQSRIHDGGDIDMQETEPEIDPEEISRKQEEAQRKHEEQQRRRSEAEKQKQELDEKIKEMEDKRKQMMQKLAGKASATTPTPNEALTSATKPAESEQTKGLREQLAKLEAEAKSLGIDPDAPANGWSTSAIRGRGGSRGRPRGRGYFQGYRGGWAAGGARGGAVKRLDNRPKTVAVTFLDGNYEDHQGALQHFLLFNSTAGDSASLNRHPGRNDTALIAFPERYQGEMFMASAAAPDFPLNGKIDLSWYKPAQAPLMEEDSAVPEATDETGEAANTEDVLQNRDMDAYDEADNDDRWG